MSGIQIAPAGPEHAGAFYEIAASVRFQPEHADEMRGFLVLPASSNWWVQALTEPTASHVALEHERVVGFIYALTEAGELRIDRIAVRASHTRRGVAQGLLDAALAAARGRPSYALIMHAPVRNRASIEFFGRRNGYRLRREDRTLGGTPQPKFVWGRYELA